MSTPTSNSVPVTTFDPLLTGLGKYVADGVKWGGALGTGVALTYSFPTGTASFITPYGDYTDAGEWKQWYALSSGERTAVQAALQDWADVCNVTFTQVADNASTVGDIRVAYTKFDTATEYAHAYLPSSDPSAGDVWLSYTNFNPNNATSILPGSNDFETLIHELGHTLGLKHSFDAPNAIPSALDNYSYTIMSYTAHTPGDDGLASFFPTTPMYYDLLAVQAMYGRNLNHNAGNTTYKFVQGGTYWQTIDDAGGHDNIQFEGSQSVAIDLRQGHFSKLSAPITFTNHSSITATVAIGPNTVIEDAYGGSGNDAITGNDAGNKLFGNDGNDTIVGGNGNDAIYGGAGNDRIYGGNGNDVIYGGAGADTFYFTNALSNTSNVDSLRDFTHASDMLYLSHSIFTHMVTGHLAAAYFIAGTHALSSAQHVIYDMAHGALYFDADGSGGTVQQVEFATVTPGTVVSASDIVVY